MVVFLDSSALVKRYLLETGSAWSADEELNRAAKAAGLAVEDPNQHP